MPKRFTETIKWDDKWFRSLRPEFKLAWLYVLDKCDAAGVLDLDEELANFQIGFQVDWKAFLEICESRLIALPKGKLWVSKFIEFQYGELSEGCKAHNPAFSSLRKHGLIERVSKGYPKGIQRDKDKDKEKDKDKDKEEGGGEGEPTKAKYPPEFESFWDAYPRVRRQDKGDAFKAWKKVINEVSPEDLIQVAKEYAASPLGSGEFSCMPATFLNKRKWEDDRDSWQRNASSNSSPSPDRKTKGQLNVERAGL